MLIYLFHQEPEGAINPSYSSFTTNKELCFMSV